MWRTLLYDRSENECIVKVFGNKIVCPFHREISGSWIFYHVVPYQWFVVIGWMHYWIRHSEISHFTPSVQSVVSLLFTRWLNCWVLLLPSNAVACISPSCGTMTSFIQLEVHGSVLLWRYCIVASGGPSHWSYVQEILWSLDMTYMSGQTNWQTPADRYADMLTCLIAYWWWSNYQYSWVN